MLNFSIFVFVGLEKHITTLLYRYQCVVVPNFGAFLSQIKPASLQRDSNTFYPPYKELSFNAQLNTNDGLLVSHIANSEGKSFEDVLQEVESQSGIWKEQLHSKGKLELAGLGIFRLNSEKKMMFQPVERINYLMSSYGLGAVIANPVMRETLKEEVQQLEENIRFSITPEPRTSSGLKHLMKYAAVLFLAVATGLSAYSYYRQQINSIALAQEEAQKEVSKNIQEATFFSADPVELPSVTLEVTQNKKVRGIHHIIAGAFRFRENADKKISQLQQKGYDSHYVGVNTFGLHQVAFASYANPKEALTELKKIRGRESADAWLLSKR